MHCVAHHDRLPQDEAFGVSGDDEQGGPALKFVRLSGRGQCHCFPGHDARPSIQEAQHTFRAGSGRRPPGMTKQRGKAHLRAGDAIPETV